MNPSASASVWQGCNIEGVKMYHVVYDTAQGTKTYCVQAMTFEVAMQHLALLWQNYLNLDGTPKTYPNGKGVYDVHNPRIIQV